MTLIAGSFTTEFSDAREQITSEQQAIDPLKPDDIYLPDEMRRILATVDNDALRATLEIKAFPKVMGASPNPNLGLSGPVAIK